MRAARLLVTATVTVSVLAALPSRAQQPIAFVPVNGGDGIKVSGALDVSNGRAAIGNSGTVTAGEGTATIALARGGQLRLCSTTTLHLTTDRSVSQTPQVAQTSSPANDAAPTTTALLIALDRGALEANYTTGKYSDVVMTPDFRVLVSGPGTADLKIRVSAKGDTCIDNHGAGAPYVTVSSQFDNGVYRVQPNQHVLFEHGSLHDVVDNEAESCGCPPPPQALTAQLPATTNPAIATAAPATTAKPGNAGTEFPIAVSEGLAPPPAPLQTPATEPGQVHVQVTVPLAYDGKTGTTASAASGATNVPAAPAVPPADQPATSSAPAVVYAPAPTTPPSGPPASQQKTQAKPGIFHRIGHFFSKIFGGG